MLRTLSASKCALSASASPLKYFTSRIASLSEQDVDPSVGYKGAQTEEYELWRIEFMYRGWRSRY